MNKSMKKSNWFFDLIIIIIGSLIFAVGIQSFCSPNHIAPGGVTGLGILVESMFGVSVSMFVLAANLPLLLLSLKSLGRKFVLSTLGTVLITSLALELVAPFYEYNGDMLLASVFGGALQGIGLGMIIVKGSTSGGSDLAAKLIQLKKPHIRVGKLLFIIDTIVLLLSAVVYGNMENALYGLISMFVASQIIDAMVYGLEQGKVLMIISKFSEEIASDVNIETGRGCTIMEGKGSYTGEDRKIIFNAISDSEFYNIKKIIMRHDPEAFVIALQANQVLGEGFKALDDKIA